MQEERYGFRSAEYSSWHRTASLRRFLGAQLAETVSVIDLDHAIWIEHAHGGREPLALIESARDVGQDWKATGVIRHLAKRANLPAYCVLYSPATIANTGDQRFADIESFRVRRVWPEPEKEWRALTPQRWAETLLVIRARGAARLDAEIAATDGRHPKYTLGTQ